jgi:hypothetical protein
VIGCTLYCSTTIENATACSKYKARILPYNTLKYNALKAITLICSVINQRACSYRASTPASGV